VVNGRVKGVGADAGEIESLMNRADRGASGPTVTIAGGFMAAALLCSAVSKCLHF
jgi:hypothetical protein